MRHDRQHLLDIIEATGSITRFLEGMDLTTFISDDRTRSAVIYQLIVVGEAANRVSEDLQRRYADVPWRLAIDTRNLFAHQYAGLNWDRVWQTATISIPALHAQVDAILTAEFPEADLR